MSELFSLFAVQSGQQCISQEEKKQGTVLSQELLYSFRHVEVVFDEVSLRKNISCTYELVKMFRM